MGQLCRFNDHPQHNLAQKYVKGKPSAILSFGVQDGLEGGTRFIDALQLFTRWSILVMPKAWHATLQLQPIAN
jgi:O-acetylhomoserine/O-acetylserine sulfhydrylase-like pyridoxal-dependent enzyme